MNEGDAAASEALLPLVYDELRKLAHQRMSEEFGSYSLQATGLVHEAYIRLVDQASPSAWNGRGHFFAAAARAMRRILVDRARRRQALKRGGDGQRVELQEPVVAVSSDPNVIALDSALQKLAEQHPEKVELVNLRYFAGCSLEDSAEMIGVSRATAQRYWAYARAWLLSELSDD